MASVGIYGGDTWSRDLAGDAEHVALCLDPPERAAVRWAVELRDDEKSVWFELADPSTSCC